jgi:hypothetical protein
MKKSLVLASIAGLALAGAANADNLVGEGHLSPGVADSWGFAATTGDLITFSIWDFTPDDDGDNDSFGGIKRPDASIADTDDDDGPGFLSILRFGADATGGWTGVVTGFGDSDLDGSGHSEDFDYRVVITTGASHAESEGNDGIGSANPISASGVARVSGFLELSGVDWYSITVPDGALITAELHDFGGPTGSLFDSMIAIYDSAGGQVAFDDDDNVGLNSGVHYLAGDGGTYYVAVTGFNDQEFDGGHDESGDYQLVISGLIPAPGAMALLGLGGLAAARRRR